MTIESDYTFIPFLLFLPLPTSPNSSTVCYLSLLIHSALTFYPLFSTPCELSLHCNSAAYSLFSEFTPHSLTLVSISYPHSTPSALPLHVSLYSPTSSRHDPTLLSDEGGGAQTPHPDLSWETEIDGGIEMEDRICGRGRGWGKVEAEGGNGGG